MNDSQNIYDKEVRHEGEIHHECWKHPHINGLCVECRRDNSGWLSRLKAADRIIEITTDMFEDVSMNCVGPARTRLKGRWCALKDAIAKFHGQKPCEKT